MPPHGVRSREHLRKPRRVDLAVHVAVRARRAHHPLDPVVAVRARRPSANSGPPPTQLLEHLDARVDGVAVVELDQHRTRVAARTRRSASAGLPTLTQPAWRSSGLVDHEQAHVLFSRVDHVASLLRCGCTKAKGEPVAEARRGARC